MKIYYVVSKNLLYHSEKNLKQQICAIVKLDVLKEMHDKCFKID